MKKLAATCLFVLMLSTLSYAEFAVLEIEGRVKNSNLIVIGKLVNVSETETENSRISKGTLVIEKVVYGNFVKSSGQRLKLEDKVRVEWANSKMIACQFGFAENEKQIWFLTVDTEGRIESLSLSTTASLDELPETNKHLKKLKRSDKKAKIIILLDDSQQNSLAETPVGNNPAISFGVYSLERKTRYYPFSALLVIIGSISLYYFLYRSRFKIR